MDKERVADFFAYRNGYYPVAVEHNSTPQIEVKIFVNQLQIGAAFVLTGRGFVAVFGNVVFEKISGNIKIFFRNRLKNRIRTSSVEFVNVVALSAEFFTREFDKVGRLVNIVVPVLKMLGNNPFLAKN